MLNYEQIFLQNLNSASSKHNSLIFFFLFYLFICLFPFSYSFFLILLFYYFFTFTTPFLPIPILPLFSVPIWPVSTEEYSLHGIKLISLSTGRLHATSGSKGHRQRYPAHRIRKRVRAAVSFFRSQRSIWIHQERRKKQRTEANPT